MAINLRLNKNVKLYLILSIFAFFLIVNIIYFKPSFNVISSNDRLLFIGLFITCCILCLTFAKFPGWIHKYVIKNFKRNEISFNKNFKIIKHKGHHPDCDKFINHSIKINQKYHCTGCVGLSIGSIIAIILSLIYLLADLNFDMNIYYLFLISGAFIITISFLDIIYIKNKKILHLILNSSLIISFFLVTISVLEITGKILFGVISLLFCFLWMDTRTQLSLLNHRQICSECNGKCKF
jgi:hypothetical protein